MKTKYSFLTKFAFALLGMSICSFGFGQGIANEFGTNNTSTHTGGMNHIGGISSTHLSFDNNEIQARNGANASILYANYYGGHIDLLGAFNTTGDLLVDGSGFFYDNSTDRIGLGTSTPSARLSLDFTGSDGILIEGDDSGDARIQFLNGGGSSYLFDDDSDNHTFKMESASGNDIAFNTNGTMERMRIESGGDVGIGINNPSTKLHVFDTGSNVARFESSGTNNFISFYNSSGYSGYVQATGSEFQLGSTSKDIVLTSNLAASDIILKSGGVDVLTLDGATNSIGIGTDAPESKLHVLVDTDGCNFGIRTGSSHGYVNTQRPSGSTNTVVQRWRDDASTMATMNDVTGTYRFTVNGSALASGGTWMNSDLKLKKNINTLEEGTLAKVMRLKPSTYLFKNTEEYKFLGLSDEEQIGFIAQDLEIEFPQVVNTTIQTDADGEVAVDHELKSVNYEALIPVLTKAIQEQQALILEQQATILEMKADIQELKNK